MSARVSAVPSTTAPALSSRRRLGDRLGDGALHGLTAAAAAAAAALLIAIAWKIFDVAHPAISKYGFGFLTHQGWDVARNKFAALDFIWGTAVTSFAALLIATPVSIAIGLYLSELAPRGARTVIASLVELLAAIPSVVLGLWGILVLGPFVGQDLEPWLHRHLGFIPLFSGTPENAGILVAILVLTIMVVPITSSICRELFVGVPTELEEGALALGATRWEMVRGVILPYTRSGVAAAVILGFGRAIGEAIAVTQVMGAGHGIHWSLFATGDTLASRIAEQYAGAAGLQVASLVYLAAILLVISLLVNLAARLIERRFTYQRTGGS
ncbi:MAG: phosphate ABC transporter permease subunit PstC [Actinobacteria bacterium]|nr:MAG: phosphate ABC transporter permease subunit PstC [Actinomycetota bacterium]